MQLRCALVLALVSAHFVVGCAGAVAAPARSGASLAAEQVHLTPGAEGESATPTATTAALTLTVTRIGHASVLIETPREHVLTDPWFTEKSGYHHGEPLGMPLSALPPLTGVVVSHGHYDHFDMEGFSAYPDKTVPFAVKTGSASDARQVGFRDVRELEPWQTTMLGGIRVTAAPAKHGVPENTYVLEVDGFTIFFGGDTLLIPELTEIAKRFPRIDLAFVPINGLSVIGAGQKVMNADEAARLCAILHPKVAVPIHYAFKGSWFTDTFILSYDGTPPRFASSMHTHSPTTIVKVLPPGQPLILDRLAAVPPPGPSPSLLDARHAHAL